MSTTSRISTILLFLFLYVNVAICWNIEDPLISLDKFEEIDLVRTPRDSENESTIWMEYEFGTGAGNREELIVADISVDEYKGLPKTGIKWQFLNVNGAYYLFRAEKSTLFFYEFRLDDALLDGPSKLNVEGTILTFKVIKVNPEVDTVAVLCVESDSGTSLRWYRLINGNFFQLFWSWPVQKRIKGIQFIQHEFINNQPDKILLVNDDEVHYGIQYTPIEVYGFTMDFSTNNFHFWLSQRILVPRALDVQVCYIYESISLVLQGVTGVLLYEYRNTTNGSIFHEQQLIKSQDLRNFACFESGYLQFLAISGPEAGLFHFVDGEFQFNTESESSFDVSEVAWVKDVKLDTYRDESLLLMQLKNSTVIALAWQGLNFKRTQLPNKILDQFDLSAITPLPRYGFILGNQVVKLRTQLKNVKHPAQYTTERLLVLQQLLNDSLNHQERILNETKERLDKSYLMNPVTGTWNISVLNATNATISDNVIYHSVTIGGKNLTKGELNFDVNSFENKLKDLEQKLDEIDSNLRNVIDPGSKKMSFDSDIEIVGNINITGTLNVGNLSVQFINGVNVSDNFGNHEGYNATGNAKIYDSIEAENLTIRVLNGVPVENIRFGDSLGDYSGVDFARINKAHINGHLSVSTINGIDWETLMRDIVWKDKPMFIPGDTTIEGTLTSDIFELLFLNNLLYPEEYVLEEDDNTVVVTGSKTFDTVVAVRLENVTTLNGVNFEDFVILNKDNVLKEEITFENLIIDGEFRVDGKISGLNLTERKLLNETSYISSDVMFLNLNVLGNVTYDTLLMDKHLLSLGDLLQKTDRDVEITGTKTFLGNVMIKSNLTITSGMINGHFIDEFVTLNTEQTFPNLKKILANVTFGNVTFGAVEKLQTFIEGNKNSNDCLEKIVVFESPIIVDELHFDKLNDGVPYEEFSQKLNETFQNVTFENLIADTLSAEIITANKVNGLDFADFKEKFTSSKVVDEYIVDRLETDHLNVTSINGMPVDEINRLIDRVTTMLNSILNGSETLDSLQVRGTIKTNSVNGVVFEDLLKEGQIESVIFKDEVFIKNLTILGYMNGFNFSERVSDTVLKTDTNIEIYGYKTFDTIVCHQLEAMSLNGRPVENILDPTKEQMLSGPVTINGSLTVLKSFNATGKIGDVSFNDLMDRFKSLGNNTFELHGDVRFPENVTVKNLYTEGLIQGKNFNKFLNSVVFKNQDNLTISGTKVFQSSVTFNGTFDVLNRLNDIDLKRFLEKAVFIDKPFSIKSKVIFKDVIQVEKELNVKSNLEAKSIMGVDVDDLLHNVLYLNRPGYVEETITFTNVSFQSNVQVERFNDLDMNLLIPLNTEQIIPVDVLKCSNVTVDKVEISGRVNNVNLKEMQENTFMLTGNQNITGHFSFRGPVEFRRNFNARLINGIDPTRFIPLNSTDPIKGSFTFERPTSFNQNLRTLSYLNGVDPNRWDAVAITDTRSLPQIISGRWTVFGNVYFEGGASGSDILNGTNVTEVSNVLAKKHLEMDAALAETNANLDSICEDLKYLKHYAGKQIYQFNVFDYLQLIEYNSSIISVHHFEVNDLDYLTLSYNTCEMHVYLFTGVEFELVSSVPDFGAVERWTTFKHDHTLYFLASGTSSCGRSPVNLWKLQENEFKHVLDLGRNVNRNKINPSILLTLMAGTDQTRSSEGLDEKLRNSFSSFMKNEDMKIVLEKNQMLLTSKNVVPDRYSFDRFNNASLGRHIRSPETLKFKAGLLEKEMFLYYDEEISKDRIFIFNNDGERKKILQTIKAHRPKSFTILNFDGLIETLLVFVEYRSYLRIYEYKGIQGFVYRDSIWIDVDKLFSFKIRKYRNLAKRYCLALVHDNRLIILEAKMYGEKLEMGPLMC